MMPAVMPKKPCNLSRGCVSSSLRCAMISTRLDSATAWLVISQKMTVLPDPVGAVVHQTISGAGVDQLPFDIGAIELAGMDKLQQTERRAIQRMVSAALCGAGEISDFIFERSVGIGRWGPMSLCLPPPHCCLCALSDRQTFRRRRLSILGQFDQPCGWFGYRIVIDPAIDTNAWPHAWRRNDHAAVASHVYSSTELRCAALNLDAVARMLEVSMHRSRRTDRL